MRTSRTQAGIRTGRTGRAGSRSNTAARGGSVLLIVTVVLMLLSLAAYTFSNVMINEYEAARLSGQAAKARIYADSGIELAATVLSNREDLFENLYHDQARFQLLVEDSNQAGDRGMLSIVAPLSNGSSAIRFGLLNESSKLSLPYLATMEDQDVAHDIMLMIPGMTDEAADCLLDWFDEDDEPREFGAEALEYADLGLVPADGYPVHSMDELLSVYGVTPELMFGEDANRNGLLDSNENDGENPPLDNEDGILDPGWAAYFTLHGKETNLASDGSERIHINNSSPQELYEELLEVLDETEAEFICAYLLFGPSNFDVLSDTEQASIDAGLSIDEEAQMAEAANTIAQGLFGAASGDSTVTIGSNEIDASGGKQYTINSIFELIDAEVVATSTSGSEVTLTSPWSSNAGSMDTYLPELLDLVTVTDMSVIRGRIDINQARYEVLLAIPEMEESVASAIVDNQISPAADTEIPDSRATHGWLWSEGVLDRETFLKYEPWFTTRGDVYSAQVVGHFEDGGPQARMDVLIDASDYPSKIIFARDLSHLGPAIPPQLLQNVEGQ